MRLGLERRVDLGVELVPHDEVRRARGDPENDRDHAGSDKRQPAPESHGSRRT
jgi:hypothetical protein